MSDLLVLDHLEVRRFRLFIGLLVLVEVLFGDLLELLLGQLVVGRQKRIGQWKQRSVQQVPRCSRGEQNSFRQILLVVLLEILVVLVQQVQRSIVRSVLLQITFVRDAFVCGGLVRGGLVRGAFVRSVFVEGAFVQQGAFIKGALIEGALVHSSFADVRALHEIGQIVHLGASSLHGALVHRLIEQILICGRLIEILNTIFRVVLERMVLVVVVELSLRLLVAVHVHLGVQNGIVEVRIRVLVDRDLLEVARAAVLRRNELGDVVRIVRLLRDARVAVVEKLERRLFLVLVSRRFLGSFGLLGLLRFDHRHVELLLHDRLIVERGQGLIVHLDLDGRIVVHLLIVDLFERRRRVQVLGGAFLFVLIGGRLRDQVDR